MQRLRFSNSYEQKKAEAQSPRLCFFSRKADASLTPEIT